MQKPKIGHICAISIIYHAENPRELFFDIKDATYPLVVWRRHFCFIGGNWTGDAGLDSNPQATFGREVKEELQLVKEEKSTAELGETAVHRVPITYKVKGLDRLPTAKEEAMLADVKMAIIEQTCLFGDYLVEVPDWVFRVADPQSPQTTQAALCSVFSVALSEDTWEKLVHLQATFGNLSCESESAIMTVHKIVREGIKGQSGQDRILQDFLQVQKNDLWRSIPLHNGPIIKRVGMPRSSYRDYFDSYDIERFPRNFER